MIKLYRGLGEASIIMGDNGSTPLWIAEDGSWGTCPITLFDAHHWTATDFDELDNAPDSEKVSLAHTIADEATAHYNNAVSRFVEETRDRALQLGIRMFRLTGEGMEELV